MGKVRHVVTVPGPISAAEELWYDTSRWSAFVDGFGSVEKVDGDWPRTGARVIWSSPPGGRGHVVELVEEHVARDGQVLTVEDERLLGRQRVQFAAADGDGVRVEVELAYKLKVGGPLSVVTDAFFVRRLVSDSLRKTVARYRIERMSDVDDARLT